MRSDIYPGLDRWDSLKRKMRVGWTDSREGRGRERERERERIVCTDESDRDERVRGMKRERMTDEANGGAKEGESAIERGEERIRGGEVGRGRQERERERRKSAKYAKHTRNVFL